MDICKNKCEHTETKECCCFCDKAENCKDMCRKTYNDCGNSNLNDTKLLHYLLAKLNREKKDLVEEYIKNKEEKDV